MDSKSKIDCRFRRRGKSKHLRTAGKRLSKKKAAKYRRIKTFQSDSISMSDAASDHRGSLANLVDPPIITEAIVKKEEKLPHDPTVSDLPGITNSLPLKVNPIIVRGSFHQGEKIFGASSRGKQCTAMAAAAIAASQVLHPVEWTTNTIDSIMLSGDDLYANSMQQRGAVHPDEENADYLAPEDLARDVTVLSRRCTFGLAVEEIGHMTRDLSEDGFPNLTNALVRHFQDYGDTKRSCQNAAILTCNGFSIAIFETGDMVWVFDSHSRDPSGKSTPDGKACLVGSHRLDPLLELLKINIPTLIETRGYENQYTLALFVVKSMEPAVNDIYKLSDLSMSEPTGACKDEAPEYSLCEKEIAYKDSGSVSIAEETTVRSDTILDNREPQSVIPNDGSLRVDHSTKTDEEHSVTKELENESIEKHQLTYSSSPSKEVEAVESSTRGIVDIGYVLSQLHKVFDNHSAFSCGFKYITFLNAQRKGLKTIYRFRCSMCNLDATIDSEPPSDDRLDLNTAMVLGAVVNGIGFFQAESFLAAMDIPCMAETTYQRYHDAVLNGLRENALLEMKKAGDEEREMAIARGDVINGIPHISVIADGSWMQRSYGKQFASPSGTGTITGVHTGKVLFFGVRNKYCSACDLAASRGRDPSNHVCYKNWGSNQSSSSMEADAICEGFNCSIEQHGLMYSVLIADGDSSVFNRISALSPYRAYDVYVKKIECCNHMERTTRRNLAKIVDSGKLGSLKAVLKNRIKSMIDDIHTATQHRLNESTTWEEKKVSLRKDILNIPSHVFGDHEKCLGTGYCDSVGTVGEKNYVLAFKKVGVFDGIENCLRRMADNADSVMRDLNNNTVEIFHNVIAKFIGGKRVHWGKRGSYNARVSGAVSQFNTKHVMTGFCKTVGKTPTDVIMTLEARRARLNEQTKERLHAARNQPKKRAPSTQAPDKDYGPEAEQTDLDELTYAAELARLREKLQEFQRTREELERETLRQGDSTLWQSARRKLLTASKFGAVCHMKKHTSCSNIVQQILYPKDLSHIPSIQYGRQNEDRARKELEQYLKCEIHECGLFVDSEIVGLGATPDGIIGDNAIVEIKCPYAARNGTVADAISQKKGNVQRIFEKKDMTRINTEHEYHYQIQGQLHITRRERCFFMVWTPKDSVVICVERDDEFWKTKMEKPLIKFYEDCIIPELVDPRYTRSMPIRDPVHILEAIVEYESRRQPKKRKTCPGTETDE